MCVFINSVLQEAVATPNIDRILHGYQWQLEKGRKQMGQNGRRKQDKDVREGVGGASSTTPDHGGSDKDDRAVYESRLMQLEKQLSQLLQQNKVYIYMYRTTTQTTTGTYT